jgi:hypothetical protein
MSEQPEQQQVVVVGADGQPVGTVSVGTDGSVEPAAQQSPADLIEQPAKVMRIGSMVKQLLEEVRTAPLDDASRKRLREVHASSIAELSDGLAPELREELDRLTLPFGDDSVPPTPSCASRRPSSSAGWRGCSTASRPPCSPSRWPPASSSSRCADASPCPGAGRTAAGARCAGRHRPVPLTGCTAGGWYR